MRKLRRISMVMPGDFAGSPSLDGITPSEGGTNGGDSLTITGRNLSTATGVLIDGEACGSFSATSSVIACTSPALAAGTYDIVVQFPSGNLTLEDAYTAVSSIFDPATLPLTGWWRAGYAGPPWVGNVSAGSSGSRDLVAGSDPALAIGAALNGYDTAEGANDSYLVNATAISSLLSATKWSAVALIRPTAITYAGSTALYNGDGIIFDSLGFCGIALGKGAGNRVYAYQWDGAECLASTNITLDAWNLVQARYDGEVLSIRVNSSAIWGAGSAGNTQTTTGTLRIGAAPSGQWFTGRIAEVMLAAADFDDETFDNIKSYVNARYDLSL